LVPVSLKPRKLWIIGENFGEPHLDNGYVFFQYCRKQGMKTVFFVVFPSAYMYAFLRNQAGVVRYGSFRHLALLALADTLIYTHTHRDLIYHSAYPIIRAGKRKVLLKHGVTTFKRFNNDYMLYKNDMDIFNVVSDYEKDIVKKCIGTENKRIRVLGFPRFDRLIDSSISKKGLRIFYFPTWRDWINEANLHGSNFYRSIKGILASYDLQTVLKHYNATLYVSLHGRMKAHFFEIATEGDHIVPVAFGERSVQDLICDCALLITDYSSVSWDFHYLGKPVIFYQFDRDEYERERGSCIDLSQLPFGNSANNETELLKLIKQKLSAGCRESAQDAASRSTHFKYIDQKNCKRVFDAISEL
jgi:CDP-glycerol glycerophosphotransferase (TagB/SpsB family)